MSFLGEQRLQTPDIKEGNLCGREIRAGGQRQREVWKVDEDEETAMFGERTRQTDANLCLANWKQQRPAPEPHSGLQQGGRGQGGRGSASMAALLAPHVVVTVLQNTEPETELGTTLLLPPSKQGGEPTSCVTVWIQHNPTCNMAALQLSQLPG